MKRLTLFAVLLALASCGHGGSSTGTVTMTFAVSSQVRSSSNLGGTLTGSVYGSIFRSIDVGPAGPSTLSDGGYAGIVERITLDNVDLTTATVSQSWAGDAGLAPDHYTFLGMLDVVYKGTHGVQFHPVTGDPVTLPTTNQFRITGGQDIAEAVTFDLVY